MKKKLVVWVIMAVMAEIVLAWVSTGLAAVPASYNISMVYSGLDKAVIPDALKVDAKTRKAVIYVAEFVDARQVADKKLVGHVREIGDARVPVFMKNDVPARIVANGIKDYLKKAGYNVDEKIVQWDLKEGSIPKKSGKIIIGGSIDELEVSCWTGVFSNDYKANIKLTLVVADAVKGTILYKGSVSVASSKTDVSFSEGQLGRQADIALGEAIEKVFEGKAVAQKIKESIAR